MTKSFSRLRYIIAQIIKEYLEGIKSIALTDPLPFNQDVVDTIWDEPHERSSGPCGPGPVTDAWLRPDPSVRVSLKVEPRGSNKALCRASGLGGGLRS